MDIPVLVAALMGLGMYSHYLLSKIADLKDQNKSMGDMIRAMAHELKELGSKNVFISEETEEAETPT
jgi:hypothetical protein